MQKCKFYFCFGNIVFCRIKIYRLSQYRKAATCSFRSFRQEQAPALHYTNGLCNAGIVPLIVGHSVYDVPNRFVLNPLLFPLTTACRERACSFRLPLRYQAKLQSIPFAIKKMKATEHISRYLHGMLFLR